MKKFLRKLFRDALDEAMSFKDLDNQLDDLMSDPSPNSEDIFAVPISLNIDSKVTPTERGMEYKRDAGAIAENDIFVSEVCGYLGEQMRELSLAPETKEALMIRGKIFGVTEVVNRLRMLGSEADKKETNMDGLDEYFDDLT